MQSPILLSSLAHLPNPEDYKAHLASWNGEAHPLDDFVRDRERWDDWNKWRSAKDDFNRTYIFSLIDFYPDPGTWLFGGIYKVLSRGPSQGTSYAIERVPEYEELVGRLKIRFTRPGRTRSLKLENYFSEMTVSELFKERYSGERFPGYDKIVIDFGALEAIVKNNKADWKNALEVVWGVYLITDKSNGKMYIGSATSGEGIWSRWAAYIDTGDGANKELFALVAKEGPDYARKNFRFTLLEHRGTRTDSQLTIEREVFWKNALMTREFGYNGN